MSQSDSLKLALGLAHVLYLDFVVDFGDTSAVVFEALLNRVPRCLRG